MISVSKLMKNKSDELLKPFEDGGKIAIVLTCNVYLAHQWYAYLREFMPANIRVDLLTERHGFHAWDKDKWRAFLKITQVSS
jgi:hypothetical protein